MLRIKQPDSPDCPELTALVLRSKAHWGYDQAFMAACADELTVRAPQLTDGITRMACLNKRIVAYCRICGPTDDAELDALFVDPDFIGSGVGRRMLNHMIVLARAAGIRRLDIASDPAARPFYEAMGAVHIGAVPSGSIAGRQIPRLMLDLT